MKKKKFHQSRQFYTSAACDVWDIWKVLLHQPPTLLAPFSQKHCNIYSSILWKCKNNIDDVVTFQKHLRKMHLFRLDFVKRPLYNKYVYFGIWYQHCENVCFFNFRRVTGLLEIGRWMPINIPSEDYSPYFTCTAWPWPHHYRMMDLLYLLDLESDKLRFLAEPAQNASGPSHQVYL